MLASNAQSRAFTKESLLKEKDQYGLPPSTNKFRSAVLQNESIFFLVFSKRPILLKRPAVLCLSFSKAFLHVLRNF